MNLMVLLVLVAVIGMVAVGVTVGLVVWVAGRSRPPQ
jgi:hypothetical protein